MTISDLLLREGGDSSPVFDQGQIDGKKGARTDDWSASCKQARVKFRSMPSPQPPNQNRRSSDEGGRKLWEHYRSQFDGHDFRIVYVDSKNHKMGLQLADQSDTVALASAGQTVAMPV